jgi:hypothetical protein
MKVSDLSNAERLKFYRAGYKKRDIQAYLDKQYVQSKAEMDNAEEELDKLNCERETEMPPSSDPRNVASMFSYQDSENLIKWQLELDSILERVEHMLRGDTITFESGSAVWKKAENEEERILNDFGVSEIMRILSMYLNRNTILSNYDEKTINFKMLDFGRELSDFFFMKYESMGLNNIEKRKLYPILVREIVDIVHSSYLRALHAGERESLREARQITQTDQLNNPYGININTNNSQRERGILNPLRYIKGRY